MLTKDEFYNALILGADRPFLFRLPRYVVHILMFILGVQTLRSSPLGSWYDILMALTIFGFLAFLILYRHVIMRRKAARYFMTSLDFGSETHLRMTEEELTLESETACAIRPWHKLFGWKENDELILLYVSDRSFEIIPKRVLSEIFDGEQLVKERLEAFAIPYLRIPAGAVFEALSFAVVSALFLYALLYGSMIGGGPPEPWPARELFG
jgi:hypothetical protein